MKAFVEIKTKNGTKTLEKVSENNKDMEIWITKMMDNPNAIAGWIDSGTFALANFDLICKQYEIVDKNVI